MSFPDSGVDVYIEGSAAVYVAIYSRNPGVGLTGDTGIYFDVYLPDTLGLVSLEIRKYYSDEDVWDLNLRELTLKMYWWNGTAWVRCSDTGVNTDENYIWARISEATTPSLMDLTGTPFGAAARPMPVGGTIVPTGAPTTSTPFSALAVLLIVAVSMVIIVTKKRRR